ncbi:hypothetical protein [Hymenobacter weizhouensis]|uniref:hypothetical protein n=1 Tax=Hymenobacter sp. YIM 151500-1 TaxID=2987689 RepID=UPI002226620E|nr:hypothetical protein [Hymenobacter sp. YIM 151500-1]UYZ62491.1 hypothetical protein OIS53_16005 [Hymenobacter sp. YIM 151500-1]
MTFLRLPAAALLLVLLTFSLSSCDVIGDIFEAGAWFSLIGVFLLVLLLWWLVRRLRR